MRPHIIAVSIVFTALASFDLFHHNARRDNFVVVASAAATGQRTGAAGIAAVASAASANQQRGDRTKKVEALNAAEDRRDPRSEKNAAGGKSKGRAASYRSDSTDKLVRTAASKHSACCLNLRPTKGAYPTPVFDSLLFAKCPESKDKNSICAAAAALYTEPLTTLYPVHYGDDDINDYQPIHFPHDDTSKDFVVTNDAWTSNQFADLAIVGTGCCFNVYPLVEPGLTYSAECNNPFLGNVDQLEQYFEYSVYVAGNFDYTLITTPTNTNIDNSVIVGGDYKSDEVTTVAFRSVTDVGSFAGIGLFVGGTVDGSTTNAITVGNNGIAEAGSDPAARIVGGYVPVTAERRAEALATISAQVCAVSQNMAALEANGIAFIDNTNDPPTLMIMCQSPTPDPCVVDLDGQVFNDSTNIEITIDDGSTLKINVSGTETIVQAPLETITEGSTNSHVVWNFIDAETILLEGVGPWIDSIVAPRAHQVTVRQSTVDADINGAVLMGHINSHFDFTGGAIRTEIASGTVVCPDPESTVTLCDCLCPEHLGSYA